MASRFQPGSIAFDKDGRSYTVEVVDGGTVYCVASNGIETEFPESSLVTESEWGTRSDGRRDISYTRLKQARTYTVTSGKIDKDAAAQLLAKAERLSPSLLDFVAFTAAQQVLTENKDGDQVDGLSIIKCRQIFDEAKPEVRASLLAGVLGTQADMLISALKLGDNLMRAMIDKGMAAHAAAFEDFLDRPRR